MTYASKIFFAFLDKAKDCEIRRLLKFNLRFISNITKIASTS